MTTVAENIDRGFSAVFGQTRTGGLPAPRAGHVWKMVRELEEGDRADLDGDPITDAALGDSGLQSEDAVVECIELESPDIMVVHFKRVALAFPPDHYVPVVIGDCGD